MERFENEDRAADKDRPDRLFSLSCLIRNKFLTFSLEKNGLFVLGSIVLLKLS